MKHLWIALLFVAITLQAQTPCATVLKNGGDSTGTRRWHQCDDSIHSADINERNRTAFITDSVERMRLLRVAAVIDSTQKWLKIHNPSQTDSAIAVRKHVDDSIVGVKEAMLRRNAESDALWSDVESTCPDIAKRSPIKFRARSDAILKANKFNRFSEDHHVVCGQIVLGEYGSDVRRLLQERGWNIRYSSVTKTEDGNTYLLFAKNPSTGESRMYSIVFDKLYSITQ